MPPAISNLTSIFRSGIGMHNYGVIASNVRNRVIGAVPKDLLSAATRKLPKGGYKERLSDINQAYEETAVILKKVEKLQSDAFERIPITDKNFHKVLKKTERIGELSYNEVFRYRDKIYEEAETECLLEAESHLLQKLSSIMTDLKNVILAPCGEGNFKKVYKLEFKFANPEKTIAPQALGVYREKLMEVNVQDLYLRFFNNVSDKAFAKSMNWSLDYTIANRAETCRKLREQAASGVADFSNMGHGAFAEANSAEYIRYMSGHKLKPEDGIVLPNLFSLNDTAPFFVSEYVGKERSAKKIFDFMALGLQHTDKTKNNYEKYIIKDLGGILSLNGDKTSSIVGSQIGTKISKNFAKLRTIDEQLKYLADLRDGAFKDKNLINRYHTLNAINEIVKTQMILA